jgi:hypothetical protein
MERKPEVVNSKENTPTLYINGIYLHSKYSPRKEAEKFISANEKLYKNKDIILVYGLGFGYHIRELLKRAKPGCQIYIFDADEEVVRISDQLGMLDEIKNDTRVKLITIYSKEFLNQISFIITKVEDILMYKASMKVLPDRFKELREVLEGYVIAKIGIDRFQYTMMGNNEANSKLLLPGMKEFFRSMSIAEETIIIAASGPSLDYSIEILKKMNGKFKIFSVGSALRTLMKNEIKPQMITIIDCQEIVYNQLIGYENLDVPLCFLNTASRWAVEKYKGPKYMFYNDANSDDVIINTGKTVAVAALDIAIKGGAKTIVFVGQDLAFLDNRTHTGTFTEMYGDSNYVPEDGIYKKIIGIDGGLLNTTEGYMYFKRQIEKEIEQNPRITFINCSKGARIKGTLEMELEEIM